MIVFEFIIVLSSLFCLYEWATYLDIIPYTYISLGGHSNIYVTVIKVCVLKWSIVLGIAGLVWVLVCFLKFAKENDYLGLRIRIAFFYLVVSVLMLF